MTLYKTTLTKIANDEVLKVREGICSGLPEIGGSFILFRSNPNSNLNMVRATVTSPVKEILSNSQGVMIFKTCNSTYQLLYKVA